MADGGLPARDLLFGFQTPRSNVERGETPETSLSLARGEDEAAPPPPPPGDDLSTPACRALLEDVLATCQKNGERMTRMEEYVLMGPRLPAAMTGQGIAQPTAQQNLAQIWGQMPAGRGMIHPFGGVMNQPNPAMIPGRQVAIDNQQRAISEEFQQESPFAANILAREMTGTYQPITLQYDGTTDPCEHWDHFVCEATLHRYDDEIKCRLFAATLTKSAQQWFRQLTANSITSFAQLGRMFRYQFASARKATKTIMTLFNLRKEEDERLRDFVTRFRTTALDVPAATQEVLIGAFMQGLGGGDFFKSLVKRPVTKYHDLLARAEKYMSLDEAERDAKLQRANKRAEGKREIPAEMGHFAPRADKRARYIQKEPRGEPDIYTIAGGPSRGSK